MKRQLIHAAAGTVLALGLTTGLAAAQTISNTQPGSENILKTHTASITHVYTFNGEEVLNSNMQGAESGSSTVMFNMESGNAASGYANNAATQNTTVDLNNSPVTTAALTTTTNTNTGNQSISGSGAGSLNVLKTDNFNMTHVATINDLTVGNQSSQQAVSGNATVKFNMVGGSATTGNASNSDTSNVTVNVTN